MSRLMFNERKAKKQMNKYEGSTGAGAGYYRDQLDVLEQELHSRSQGFFVCFDIFTLPLEPLCLQRKELKGK